MRRFESRAEHGHGRIRYRTCYDPAAFFIDVEIYFTVFSLSPDTLIRMHEENRISDRKNNRN